VKDLGGSSKVGNWGRPEAGRADGTAAYKSFISPVSVKILFLGFFDDYGKILNFCKQLSDHER